MQKLRLSSLLGLLLVLGLTFSILFFALPNKSPTTDETVHLPAGYSYVKTRDFRVNPEHPPLAKLIYGISILNLKPKLPSNFAFYQNESKFDKDNWQIDRSYGEDFLFNSGNDPQSIFFYGRLAAIGLSLLLVATVFFASRATLGERSSLIATFLIGLSPIVLGHGNLTNTDIAASLGFVLAVWAMWNYITNSSMRSLVLLALAFSLTAFFKYTFVILVAIYIVLKIYNVFILRKRQRLVSIDLRRIAVFAGIFLILLLAVYSFNPEQMKYFYKGLKMVMDHTTGGHTTYFLGQLSNQGWWYYFPVAIALKNPFPTLLLIALGLINFIFNFRKPSSFWLLSGLTYLVVAMNSKANLGVRHVLPAVIMFIVYGSSIFSKDSFIKSSKILVAIAVAVVLWQGYEVAANYPYYISYFNQAVKTADKAFYMTDSNLDWGQDGKYIADFARDNNLKNVYIDYGWTPQTQFARYGLTNYGYASEQMSGQAGNYLISSSALEVYKSNTYSWLTSYPRQYLFGGTVVWIEVK